jgi:uncharacterized protein (PEP-CTERM system associated)
MAATENKLHRCSAGTAPRRQAPLAGAFSVFMAIAFAPAVHAVDWRFEPTLNASATYTDNVNQSASNPENALILSATPAFNLHSEGSRRVQATMRYGLTGVKRFGGDQNDNFYHNLNAVGKAELVEDFLFIDGSARVSQELISLFGSPADAAVNDSNRATVGTYSVSPYIQKRLGTFANAQARYTASGAIFENDVAARSSVNAFTAALTSGTRFTDFSWGLNYSIRDAQNRNAVDTTFERASATAGYALTRKFRVFGSVGQDWNDYLSASGTNGSSYSAGFGWAPTRRTNIEASVGERYFGRTFSLAGNHRTRLSHWTVRYYEDISDISQQLVDASNRTFWECPLMVTIDGVPVAIGTGYSEEQISPDCEGPFTPLELEDRGVSPEKLKQNGIPIDTFNRIFIIKNLTAGVSWDIGRLGFGLFVHDTKRLYPLLNDAQDSTQGVTGSVSYRMSPRTTANSSLSLTRNSADALVSGGTVRDDDIWTLNLGLNHEFAEDLRGALTFRHTQRDSNLASADYDENRIMATVNMRF